jgi:hypothetical protein
MSKFFKYFGIFIFVLIVLGVVVGMMGGSSSNSTTNNTSVVNTANNSSEETPIAKTDYIVGQTIENSGRQLTVTKVTRNYSTGNQFSVPKTGKEFVLITVSLKNNGNSEVMFGGFDFKVQDSNGVQSNTDASTYSLEDILETATLAKGGNVAGSMIFEVPKDDKNLVLLYNSSFWTGQQIKVKLS